jgi:hypothetical protein
MNKADQAAHAQTLADAYADMKQRFPNMPWPPTHRVFVTRHRRGRASLDGPQPWLATKAEPWSAEVWDHLLAWERTNGRLAGVERRETQVADNFRHELAHNLTTPEVLSGWRSQVMAVHDLDWFKQHVSDYCAKDGKDTEALAETFALVTRPGYTRGGLPAVIEEFIFNTMLRV